MNASTRKSRNCVSAWLTVLALLASPAAQAQWSERAPMPTARSAMAVAAVNGRIYVFGGAQTNPGCFYLNTGEVYDTLTDTWAGVAPMAWNPDGAGAAVVDGQVYVGGGLIQCGSSYSNFAAYNPASNTWTAKAPMPLARGRFAMGSINGIVYAAGGGLGSGVTGVLQAYDTATDTWSQKAPMPTARMWMGSTVHGGKLYVMGGFNGSVTVGANEAYDPAANTWTALAPMPTPRTGAAVAALNGKLYVMGGGYTSPVTSLVEVYDPATNTWSTGTPLPTARATLGAVAWNGVLYAIGGSPGTLTMLSRVDAFIASAFMLSVARTGDGSVMSSPPGITCAPLCSAPFPSGSSVTLTAMPRQGSVFAGWSGACTGTGPCTVSMSAAQSVAAAFSLATEGVLTATPPTLDFGGQSMGTTSPEQAVALGNSGGSPLAVTSIATSAPFSAAHDCGTLAPGAQCSARVAFTPSAPGAAGGTLQVQSSAGTRTVGLSGAGERSLVTHYYRSILRRAPDAGGKAFWEGEVARLIALGANVNEAWFAMAMSFYTSAEYEAFNRGDAEFVIDLYRTFFNRPPDAPGLAYWTGQLGAGLPREVLLASFMFSPEFVAFTRAIFGDTSVRGEVDAVVDFYRGVLSRLSDDSGHGFWVERFRTAQCQGAQAVVAEVDAISRAFLDSPEYAGRNRSHAQFVGDLYNAFLRRGGDVAGVQFWIRQLEAGATTRDAVRRAFIASPEFNARVNAILAAGCVPGITAIDAASAGPLGAVSVRTRGFDLTQPTEARFSNAAGFSAAGAALRVHADGSVAIAVPIYFDPASGQPAAGSVSLTLAQGDRVTAPVPLAIGELPPLSHYGTAPGEISRAALVLDSMLLAQRINQFEMFAALATNPVDTASTRQTLENLLVAVIRSRIEVERLMADASLVIEAGTAPDGRVVRIDREALIMMDRVLGVYLENLLADSNLGSMTTPSAGDAVPKATSVGLLVDFLQKAGNIASVQSAMIDALTQEKKLDKAIAVMGGIATIAAELAPKAGPLVGAVGAAVSSARITGEALGNLAAFTQGLATGDAALVDAAASTMAAVPKKDLYRTLGNLVLAVPAISSTLIGGSASAIMSLVEYQSTVIAATEQTHDKAAEITEHYRKLPASSHPKSGTAKGQVRGGAGRQDKVEVCCFPGGKAVSTLGDREGRFELTVPTSVPGTDYGNLTLKAIDPIRRSTEATHTVDLRPFTITRVVELPVLQLTCRPPTCADVCLALRIACNDACPTTPLLVASECINQCSAKYNSCPAYQNFLTCTCHTTPQ